MKKEILAIWECYVEDVQSDSFTFIYMDVTEGKKEPLISGFGKFGFEFVRYHDIKFLFPGSRFHFFMYKIKDETRNIVKFDKAYWTQQEIAKATEATMKLKAELN